MDYHKLQVKPINSFVDQNFKCDSANIECALMRFNQVVLTADCEALKCKKLTEPEDTKTSF